MTVEEAIELINTSNNCYSLGYAKDLLKDCEFMKRQDYTGYGLYIKATDIYKVEDGYIGVRGIPSLKSDRILYVDCVELCIAKEYEAVQTTTYVPKNN